MGIAVSVVAATYCPGDGLQRLIRSLDRQSLPQSQFEIVLVDDGSPDDTWDELVRLRDARANVQIARIENSGWPSAPRNVGTDLATGEYVLYADHDDEIFPDGLRAAAGFAASNDLDILSAKEIKTGSPGFGFDAYRRDVCGPRGELGIGALIPMMPHKFYRRRMLADHAVRFPEGRRMFWEDIFFNVDAYVGAERIGILASSPVYRRIMGTANASKVYKAQNEEYWDRLIALFEHVDAGLASAQFATDRALLLAYQYRVRVLDRIAPLMVHDHEEALRRALPAIRTIWQRWAPESIRADLTVKERLIDSLLRAEDFDALHEVAAPSADVVGISRGGRVCWDQGSLAIRSSASWSGRTRPVPQGFLAPDPGADTDADTDALAGELEADLARTCSTVVLLDRFTQEAQAMPTARESIAAQVSDPLRTLRVTATGTVDPRALADHTVYDVQARNSALGFTNQRGIRTDGQTVVALVEGRAVTAYRNGNGILSIDVGQRLRSVVNSSRPRFRRMQLHGLRPCLTVRVDLPLDGVHVWGTTRIEGSVLICSDGAGAHLGADPDPERQPAALIGEDGRAVLRMVLPARSGTFRLAFDFTGRTVPAPMRWTVPAGDAAPVLSAIAAASPVAAVPTTAAQVAAERTATAPVRAAPVRVAPMATVIDVGVQVAGRLRDVRRMLHGRWAAGH